MLLGELGVLGSGLGGRAAAAAEPTADGVADGGSDCDTAGERVSLEFSCVAGVALAGLCSSAKVYVRSGGSHLAEQTGALGSSSRRGSGGSSRRGRGSSRVLASGCWGGGRGLCGRDGRPGADGGGSSTLTRHDC